MYTIKYYNLTTHGCEVVREGKAFALGSSLYLYCDDCNVNKILVIIQTPIISSYNKLNIFFIST